MKRSVKMMITLTLLILLTVELGQAAFTSAARAEMPDPTPTPDPLQVIDIRAVPTPSAKPQKRPQAVINDYHMGSQHIEAVARGMWGLNTTAEKRGFAFLVVNRTYCSQLRADGKREWADSIKGNVEKPGEFFFYDPEAPVSKENYELAELFINAQTTYILTQQYTGYPFPSTMLFMSWDGDKMSFMTERGGEPWVYEG